ncbi:MAG TPA: potassium transporter Kup [Polyangiaceae bacterium]|nr:potassium transporter Kup [Polyangiaceae bacterium]
MSNTAGAHATPGIADAPHHVHRVPQGKQLVLLSLGALGVVFGDIGTSPLYSVRECLHGEHGIGVSHDGVLGVLSLIFWALTLIISIKYVGYVLRADNQGEGGILALMALVTTSPKVSPRQVRIAIMLGLFGAALLFGDGVITPAISVLSAVEGLEVATPKFSPYVVPLSIIILLGLFRVQKRGTGDVGAVFGPIMVLWFFSIGAVGASQILRHPQVLAALSPAPGLGFLLTHGHKGFLVLGSVFLAVTGGEALYADMGHFGARPMRVSWFGIALPALLLNYFGQGALLLREPEAVENPFFRAVPQWGIYPMVVLSTVATIIASQALISGAFSLARQALMLGYLPRVTVEHTSDSHIGQIYVPTINWLLMLATVALVFGFKSSSALAAAYGVAVTLNMMITTLLAYVVARHRWRWSVLTAGAVSVAFLVPEATFASSNLAKVADGGWFPLAVGVLLFTIFTTWRKGRDLLSKRFRDRVVPLDDFFELMRVEIPARVPGTAVFMTGTSDGTPPALLHNFLHNRVVHEHVVLLTIITESVARVHPDDRVRVEELPNGFRRAVARYGFMETPDIPTMLERPELKDYSLDYVTFFLGKETVLPTKQPDMALWRERLFAFLSRNAQPATAFFGIPPSRVVEIGAQIEL